MRSPVSKLALTRTVGMTAAICAASSIAFVGTSYADQPPTGVACAAKAPSGATPEPNSITDGKISGRGASFAKRAMDGFIEGYKADVCGPVAVDSPGAGNNMLTYNGTNSSGATGSGQGVNTVICRKDAFGMSDIPYDQASLAQMNGAPPPQADCAPPNQPAYTPFYQPLAPWPDAADQQSLAAPGLGGVMSFPVAGASNAIIINLPNGACPNRPAQTPTIKLSTEVLSKLAGGDILTWGDSRLVTGGPGTLDDNATLAGCTVPVTRAVRRDKSGTTQIFKTYLANSDGNRQLGSAPTCAAPAAPPTRANPDHTFLALDANNVDWAGAPGNHPGGAAADTSQPVVAGGGCSAVINGASSGNVSMIAAAAGTVGAFAYPDLADALASPLQRASVQAKVGVLNFQLPGTTAANCDFPVTLPGSNTTANVGLDLGDNWAIDNAGQNHSDTTFQGSKYPVCGLTFVLVHSGLADTTRPDAISRLTQNQRRTLHSFVTYMLSPAAQNRMGVASTGSGPTLQPGVQGYAKLPPQWLTPLRVGFRTNF